MMSSLGMIQKGVDRYINKIPKSQNLYEIEKNALHGNAHVFRKVPKVKFVTKVDGDPKAPFSIATTPRCRGGRYSFPWIVPLYPRS